MSSDYDPEQDHRDSVQEDLGRIADALERIAAALDRANPEPIPGMIG